MASTSVPAGEIAVGEEGQECGSDRIVESLRARVAELEKRVERLTEAEVRYRSLLARGKEGIWRISHTKPISIHLPVEQQVRAILEVGCLTECNEAMAQMYGAKDVTEMIGKRVGDLLDPNSEATQLFLHAFIANNYSLNDVESEERDLEGRTKWFLNSFVGVVDEDFLIGAWGSQRDVTESHRAARQYRFQRSFLRNVIDALPSPVFVKDESGKYILANRALAEVYGTDVETLEGRRDDDFRSAEESEEFRAIDREVLESGADIGPYLLKMSASDGRIHFLETTKRPIPGYEQGESYVLGVCNDVTERERAEQERLKIRQAIDFASDAITITDLFGNLTYANPAFERLVGCSFEELRLIGGPKDLYANDAELQVVVNAIDIGGSFEGEVSLHRVDGSVVVVYQRIDLIRDPNGEAISILGLRTDIGDRKRLEGQLRQTEKLAALGELVAGVAHELNNPLATISAHAQLLQRSSDLSVSKRAEGILRMVDRASRIGKSLLTFARNARPDRRRHSINDIVRESLDLYGSKLRQEKIQIQIELDHNEPQVFVDESQLEQIVVNLISNAAYATREAADRRIEIRTGQRVDHAFLVIGDNGGGIPVEIQGRVFEPFFTTKPIGEGTGLGLSICHGLAEANNGTLQFAARQGGGTVFTLSFPLLRPAAVSGGT